MVRGSLVLGCFLFTDASFEPDQKDAASATRLGAVLYDSSSGICSSVMVFAIVVWQDPLTGTRV